MAEILQTPSGGRYIGTKEGLWQPLWDRVQVDAGAPQTVISFFTTGYGGGRTEQDTNVASPSALPGGTEFLVTGMAAALVPFDSAVPTAADFANFGMGLFRFYKGESEPFKAPLRSLGGMGGITGSVPAAAAGDVVLNNGTASTNDYYMFPSEEYYVLLRAESNFKVVYDWGAAAPWVPTRDYMVYVTLAGYYARTVDRY